MNRVNERRPNGLYHASWNEVFPSSLECWPQLELPSDFDFSTSLPESSSLPNVVFEVNESLNDKIILHLGDVASLHVDAVVNSTNEEMKLFTHIIERGGPELERECRELHPGGCRTGECRVTRGFNLPATHVIHTVGPMFTEKYAAAAEHALLNTYRNSLAIVREERWRSVAFPCIYRSEKLYPRLDGAHVALRTIRLLLEKVGDSIDTVVFAHESGSDYEIYRKLLPIYFPRNEKEEEYSARALLAYQMKEIELGRAEYSHDGRVRYNDLGEKIVLSRDIRIAGTFSNSRASVSSSSVSSVSSSLSSISSTSSFLSSSSYDYNKCTSISSGISQSPMRGGGYSPPEYETSSFGGRRDRDKTKKSGDFNKKTITPNNTAFFSQPYEKLLRRARCDPMKDIVALNVVYEVAGKDADGRPVLVIIGKYLPVEEEMLNRVFLHLIKTADAIVDHKKGFVVLYANSEMSVREPALSWLRKAYNVLDRRYKKNLHRIFVIHPTKALKFRIWFARLFLSRKFFRKKLKYIDSLGCLYHIGGFKSENLPLPAHIFRCDKANNLALYADAHSRTTTVT